MLPMTCKINDSTPVGARRVGNAVPTSCCHLEAGANLCRCGVFAGIRSTEKKRGPEETFRVLTLTQTKCGLKLSIGDYHFTE